MPTNVSEHKGAERSANVVLESSDHVTILEEHVQVEAIVADSTVEKRTTVGATHEQKLPHFYQHKIRVRKYDFL